jgi:hypothetical protein
MNVTQAVIILKAITNDKFDIPGITVTTNMSFMNVQNNKIGGCQHQFGTCSFSCAEI